MVERDCGGMWKTRNYNDYFQILKAGLLYAIPLFLSNHFL